MKLIKFFILFGFLFFETNIVFAGISVSPGAIEVVAIKGEEIVKNFTVVNPGTAISKVNISIVNFSDKDQIPSAWLRVEPMEFELKAGETKEASCKIKPLMEAEGELRARVCISSKELGENAAPIGVRFNMPVYVGIQNTIILNATVDEICVRYDFRNKKIEGEVYINNKSNVHIRPEIKLIIKDLKDNLIGNIMVPVGQPAQKEENRMFLFEGEMELMSGKYKIIADVNYGAFYGLKDYVASKIMEFEVKP